jgi:cysteinyl-tRNA synthetase
VNFLNADKGKMSKSTGDFLRLESIKEKNISPLSYKYLLLMTHYRKELKFSWDSLEAANNAYLKLLKQIDKIKTDKKVKLTEVGEKYLSRFVDAMNDDLNTSISLATLWRMLGDKELIDEEKYILIKEMDKYFGLELLK